MNAMVRGATSTWRRTLGALAFVVVLILGGCGGPPTVTFGPSSSALPISAPSAVGSTPTLGPSGESQSTIAPTASAVAAATAPLDAASIDAARTLILAADFAIPQTLDDIGPIRFSAAGEWAARDVLSSMATGEPPSTPVLWAAVWVYGAAGVDPEPIRPLLTYDDPSIRAMAAACLVSMGDVSGFAALGDSLAIPDYLKGSDPPLTIKAFVAGTLERYVTGVGVPASAENDLALEQLPEQWSAWLSQNAAQLQFDPSDGDWKLP